MSVTMHSGDLSMGPTAYVVIRLEEAGGTLLALPHSGYGTQIRCGMPTVVHSAIEAYGWTPDRMRMPVPSARRISQMEEALAWISYIPQDRYVLRRIVGARALFNPLTERHLFSWRRLAAHVGCDRRALERWHSDGIALIVAELYRRKFNFPA